jgi:hypothetical protein
MHARLPGEPEHPALVEHRRVEIGIRKVRRQPINLHLAGDRIDAGDGVLSALGQPGGVVGPDNNAMRRRARPERHMLGLAGRRIEYAEHPEMLARIPDLAVRRRRHVVRIGPRGKLVEAHGGRLRRGREGERQCGGGDQETSDHAGILLCTMRPGGAAMMQQSNTAGPRVTSPSRNGEGKKRPPRTRVREGRWLDV